jgi:hypothetical protein
MRRTHTPFPIRSIAMSSGSDSKNLKYNADGSLTIYLQADNPGGDKESN